MISAPSSSSSSSANPQSPGIKTSEGKYKLHYEKTHPSGLLHYTDGKTVTQVKPWIDLLLWNWSFRLISLRFRLWFPMLFVSNIFGEIHHLWLNFHLVEIFESGAMRISEDWILGNFGCYQVTLAHLKDKPAPSTPTGTSSSTNGSGGFRSATARLLGGGNGNRALSFVGGNGGSKNVSASARIGASYTASSSTTSASNPNFDGKGSYLLSLQCGWFCFYMWLELTRQGILLLLSFIFLEIWFGHKLRKVIWCRIQ